MKEVPLLDMMAMLREGTVRLAWSAISQSVREAGREILKDPGKMAAVLRQAADALDKYARDQREGKEKLDAEG